MEQSFRDAWLEAILDGSEYFLFDRLARTYGMQADDLKQDVAEWFIRNAEDLEQKAIQAKVTANYLVRVLNNRAKHIAQKHQADRWEASGQFTYTKDFIRKNKHTLAHAFGDYTLASEAHAVYVDFDKAFGTLTGAEQDIFLTPPADYPEEAVANQSFRNKVAKLTTRMYKLMNNEAYLRLVGGVNSE